MLCTIVIDRFYPEEGHTLLDDGFAESVDFHVEGISELDEELYKDEIMSEVIYMRVEYGQDADYVDPDSYHDRDTEPFDPFE